MRSLRTCSSGTIDIPTWRRRSDGCGRGEKCETAGLRANIELVCDAGRRNRQKESFGELANADVEACPGSSALDALADRWKESLRTRRSNLSGASSLPCR